MGISKLQRFAENATFPNVIQPSFNEVFNINHTNKGKWANGVFGNKNPIVLELGCGRGEYTVALAKKYPNKNFIGIDIKGARIYYGAKESLESGLKNVVFIRTRIDFLNSFFFENEISEIWLTFPDPQKERERKRLTSPKFIEKYKNVLVPKGILHLKTDSVLLYEYTVGEIEKNKYTLHFATNHLYQENENDIDIETKEILSTQTFYESLYRKKGMNICYLRFSVL
ncbi:MAG: tRNA (guanosine(46)-N7)-methyltransferase TrmB [Bacteroidetes bacterium]|nr:tRNA (guanosine(46)-N7)-methyltransferase TrmB [Bacteroidota bacterium]MBV6461165.1 tRNA (guanine-N(7)-)-methyltransferase [Flavobacteriales bacterium]WKZ75425.1 MAG: tRNA (guanosine(46)-N7)-methyltransferase TrmB [Vicingaceae bacterium]MCL4814998.1 tRNA (guanosine(46)-N7)-methyltransferase TrmB [Flavobacteriales bacterium]NOG96129.1 tRNA (guanosine(46)-N7)-methyltransferase TrmB [Bacteroidota bacterium]